MHVTWYDSNVPAVSKEIEMYICHEKLSTPAMADRLGGSGGSGLC